MDVSPWLVVYTAICIALMLVLGLSNFKAIRSKKQDVLPEEENFFISLNGEKE